MGAETGTARRPHTVCASLLGGEGVRPLIGTARINISPQSRDQREITKVCRLHTVHRTEISAGPDQQHLFPS